MSENTLKDLLGVLASKMEDGSVAYVKRRVEPGRGIASKMPQAAQSDREVQLPVVMGVVDGINYKVELIPYPDGGYVVDIGALSGSPFKLELFLEDYDVKSLKFKGTSFGFLPVEEIETGIPEFDDKYFVEAMNLETVNIFLQDEETRRSITALGKIDKLSVQSRFTKLNYFLEDSGSFDVDWTYDKIKTLSVLMKKLKSINE